MSFRISVILIILATITSGSDPVSIPLERVGNIDKEHFREPSGICFHTIRSTLFVAGDEGHVCEIKTDGTLIRKTRIRHADFEGITFDPATGMLYIAVEGDERILEVDPDKLQILRQFSIPRTYQGRTVMKKGGNGIEAITFAADPAHPHGGTFFVANQSFDLDSPDDVSGIFEVEVPLKHPDAAVKILNHINLETKDLSGLHYDASTGNIFVLSDRNNLIMRINRKGKILKKISCPGKDQEGITFDDNGFMYITQDCGGIMKFKIRQQSP